jgi:hypothetical protein
VISYGSPDPRRLRAGRYRVFCMIDQEQRVIQIDLVASPAVALTYRALADGNVL